MNILCKRFESEEGPMTINEISSQYQIPIRLTSRTVFRLVEMRLISETFSLKDKDVPAYQPAVDINKLTIGYIFEKMFEHGSEDFKLDTDNLYKPHWEALVNVEKAIEFKGNNTLIKDL
jgi:membrane protein